MDAKLAKEIAGNPAGRAREGGESPIELTDFDIKNLRMFEITPQEGVDCQQWPCVERPMTDREFRVLNFMLDLMARDDYMAHVVLRQPLYPIGTEFFDGARRVRGYIKRKYTWNNSLENLDGE